MIAVDTNVLVRYAVNDDPRQALIAAKFLSENRCFVQYSVLLETVWVLGSKSTYNMPREDIVRWIRRILGLRNVFVVDPKAIEDALAWFADGMDFADALHFSTSQDVGSFASFDRRFRNKAKQLGVDQRLVFLGGEEH